MEKVTFVPLTELLEENAENLNQQLKYCSSGRRDFDFRQIPVWFKQVIEPVFAAVYDQDESLARRTFDMLFSFMIKALCSGGDGVVARKTACLLSLNPALIAGNPGRMLGKLYSAAQKISRHDAQKTDNWLELMSKIMPLVSEEAELLKAGRVAAWRCGMAHLRLLSQDYQDLPGDILKVIFAEEAQNPEKLLQRWVDKKEPQKKAVGGFTGYGGPFSWPPLVAVKDDTVFAFDGKKIAALFVDRYGAVFQDCPAELKETLRFGAKKIDSGEVEKWLAPHSDVTSSVYCDKTIYFTLSSSHLIFVVGAVDD